MKKHPELKVTADGKDITAACTMDWKHRRLTVPPGSVNVQVHAGDECEDVLPDGPRRERVKMSRLPAAIQRALQEL